MHMYPLPRLIIPLICYLTFSNFCFSCVTSDSHLPNIFVQDMLFINRYMYIYWRMHVKFLIFQINCWNQIVWNLSLFQGSCLSLPPCFLPHAQASFALTGSLCMYLMVATSGQALAPPHHDLASAAIAR